MKHEEYETAAREAKCPMPGTLWWMKESNANFAKVRKFRVGPPVTTYCGGYPAVLLYYADEPERHPITVTLSTFWSQAQAYEEPKPVFVSFDEILDHHPCKQGILKGAEILKKMNIHSLSVVNLETLLEMNLIDLSDAQWILHKVKGHSSTVSALNREDTLKLCRGERV